MVEDLVEIAAVHARAGAANSRAWSSPEPQARRWLGRRWVLLAVMGVLIGAASWILWQQNSTTTAMVQQAAMESGVADPGETAEAPHGLDQTDAQDLPAALATGLQSEDPLVAVSALSAVRDIALGERRLDLLDLVNAPGSQAEATDKQVSDYLRDAGTAFVGLHTALTALTVEGPPRSPIMCWWRLLPPRPAMRNAWCQGAVVRTGAAGTPQQLRLDLVRSDGRWRISGILDAVRPGKGVAEAKHIFRGPFPGAAMPWHRGGTGAASGSRLPVTARAPFAGWPSRVHRQGHREPVAGRVGVHGRRPAG